MKTKNSLLAIIVVIFLVSCDKKRFFDDYKSVGTAWHKDSIVSFDLPELETEKKYNLFLTLRDNNSYPFNNIFLIVSLENPTGFTKVDTLQYQMTNPDGSLMGDGFTDIKENKLFYKENVSFKGKYKVHIKQAIRENGKISGVNELDGVTEVGFRIENRN